MSLAGFWLMTPSLSGIHVSFSCSSISMSGIFTEPSLTSFFSVFKVSGKRSPSAATAYSVITILSEDSGLIRMRQICLKSHEMLSPLALGVTKGRLVQKISPVFTFKRSRRSSVFNSSLTRLASLTRTECSFISSRVFLER